MAIVQDVLLKFNADTSDITRNAVDLAARFQQSQIPAGEAGSLDAKERAALEEEIKSRAAATGLTYKEVRDTLAEMNRIAEEIATIEQENKTLKDQQLELDKAGVEQLAKKQEKLREAATLAGLAENATHEEIVARRDELSLLNKKGQLNKKEQAELKQINHLLRSAGGHQGEYTKLVAKNADLTEKLRTNTEKIDNSINRYSTISRTIVKSKEEEENIMERLAGLQIRSTTALNVAAKNADSVKKALEKATAETVAMERATNRTKDNFATKAISALAYYEALTLLKRAARAAAQTLRDLDRALTDIAVVTTMTREESWALLDTYQTMAKEVGLTTSEVAKLSIEFFRQGREAADALELTKTAAEFAKIAAIDVKEAANFLTAAINGFNLSAADASRIIDRFAALGAGAAASAQEIAIALSKVAPAAASAGVEVDTLMAFVTKGIETTREAPENIGTAFKTVFARMRQLTDLGKTIEDGLDVNKVDNALKSIGVELRNANGEFRDLDDVLIEVGQRWDNINRNQQAYVATSLAGTRQQTRLIALFEDFDRTLELVELSQNSAGAAALQHDEYMQGMAAATARLNTSFQQLVTSFADSDVIIGFINALNTAVELLNTGAGRLILTLGVLRVTIATLTSDQSKWGSAIKGFVDSEGWKSFTTSIFSKDKIAAAKKAWTGLFNATAPRQELLRKIDLWEKKALGGAKNASQATIDAIQANATSMRQRAIANTTSLAKLKTGFAAFGKFMLSPLGLIGIFLLLVVIFKKVRDATDTTNVTVAKLKIVFDKIAKAVQDLWQKIKNLLIPVLEGLKNAAEFLGIGAGGLLVGLFDLSPIEEAAAEFRVLSNEIKTLNAEIKDLQKENDKLNKTLEEYSKLATIGFKSTQQIASMAEAERSLQNILSEARGYQVTLTGAELIDEAARLFDEQTQAIIANQQEQTDSINAYFKKYPINFSQALEDESFADMVGDVKKVAQTYGISLIQKFEDMEPEVQEALRRMISFDPIGFLDSANKVIQIAENTGLELTRRMMSYSTDRSIQFTNVSAGFTAREGETPEEAFARAQAEIPELQTTYEEFLAMLDGSLQAAETTASNLYQTVLPAVATEMTRILDPKQADDFAEGIMALQNMDLSKLTTDELDLLQRTYPSLAQILDLPGTAEQLQAIADAGGASFLRSFGAVQETIAGFASSLGGRSRSQNNKLATQLSSSLIDILTSDDLASSVDAAMNDVFRGAVGGVIIPEGERIGLANELLDMIPKMDDEALRVATFSFAEDMQNLAEIANKSRADMTEKDLELLSKYPQALRDIEKGTFNINQLREEESQRILENLQAEEDGLLTRHNTAKRVLLEELKSGEKTVEQYERALQIENDEYAASLATLNILRDKITAQDSLTKEQEDQYKVQLDALKAQKDSIAKAKELQKLQQDSADIARRSLEATRIGAVGTIEAQFNQQQLNQEIAQMNKDLQDRIMLAQIEAQQKILEDSQQKAIEAATVDNTNATIENTVAERELNETLKTIATNPTALVSRPNVLDRFDSAADQSNAFLAIQE